MLPRSVELGRIRQACHRNLPNGISTCSNSWISSDPLVDAQGVNISIINLTNNYNKAYFRDFESIILPKNIDLTSFIHNQFSCCSFDCYYDR